MIIMLCVFIVFFGFYYFFSVIPLPNVDWRASGIFFILLTETDRWTTRRFLKRGLKEKNPLWAFLFRKIGVGWSHAAWTLIVVFIVFFWWKNLDIAAHFAFITTFILVIIWNLIVTPRRLEK